MVGRTLALLALIAAAFAQLEEPAGDLKSWDLDFAKRTVWFSAAAYCSKDSYLTRTWKGPTSGFKATKVIYHKGTDTNGYVGYHPSTSSIYVVFRGTNSLQNWITDLKFAKADYPYPRCSGCEVHKGFYQAEQAVISDVLAEVKRLRGMYPSYQVVVTGHSLGAALAQLTAVDIKAAGYPVVSYHIGCPRVGDASFAKFVQGALPDIHRIVHDVDIVPHVPLQDMNFHHVAYEYFETGNVNIKKCNNSGEDNSCSNKYSLSQTTVDAHLVYLGIGVNCQTVSTEEDFAEEMTRLRAAAAIDA